MIAWFAFRRKCWDRRQPKPRHTPADVYFARYKAVLKQRERIKQKAFKARRLHHGQRAA